MHDQVIAHVDQWNMFGRDLNGLAKMDPNDEAELTDCLGDI